MNNRKKFLFLIFYLSLNILIFSETVTVRIFSKYVISKAEVITKTESGSIKRTLIELIDDNIIVMENGKLILKNEEVHIKSGLVLAAGQSREYPGDLTALIFPGEKGIVLIASMDIDERAKRAMLAEVIEDRIFELTDAMEQLLRVQADPTNEDNTIIPESNRQKAIQLAQQTKSLQIQYEELVSGNPSTVLNTFQSVGSDNNNSKDNDNGDSN